MSRIVVSKDFSEFPAGRFRNEGPKSGQAFREDILVPMLKANTEVTIDLDGTEGYGSSFLEEAFGGLVRTEKYSSQDLKQNLKLSSSDIELCDEIWSYIDQAQPE